MAKEDKKSEDKNLPAVTGGGGALVPADMMEELIQDAGAGTSQNASDNIVPFYALLQDMNPEVKKRDPAYVDGAEPGMILNKATKKLYAGDQEMAQKYSLPLFGFQHCAFDHAIVEWVPRDAGGGFVARHDIIGTVEESMARIGGKQVQDPKDPNKKVWVTADGKHDLIDTRYHFGYGGELDNWLDTCAPGVLAFSSTGHTASRDWMTQMNEKKIRLDDGRRVLAPAWFFLYGVGSRSKKNNKGDFFVLSVNGSQLIADAGQRAAGKQLWQSVGSGLVRADEQPAEGVAGNDVI